MLVRFNSGFPWPVNLIHYFVLAFPIPLGDSMIPPSMVVERPELIQTIPAPVRLFSVADMLLSRWPDPEDQVFVLWLDTHVEHLYQGGTGQRLAGRLISCSILSGADTAEGGVELDDPMSLSNSSSGEQGTCIYGAQEDNTWTKTAFHSRSLTVAIGTEHGTVHLRRYS